MSTLNIFGYTFDLTLQEDRFMGGDGYGKANNGTGHIVIAADLSPEQQQSTLLHEIFEIVNAQFALDLNEKAIRVPETTLFQVLTANGVDLAPLLKDA